MAKLCSYRVRMQSLWRLWYCGLVLLAEGYLVYRAIALYGDYNKLPWVAELHPERAHYAYMALMVLSILSMPFFIVTCVLKLDNYANDGVKLGRDNLLADCDVTQGAAAPLPQGRWWRSLWRHIAPLSETLHVFSAFCLLLPRVLFQAQEVQHGFVSSDGVWKTELYTLFGAPTTPNVTDVKSASPSGGAVYYASISPEFINYAAGLIVLAVRYPSVFWFTNRSFTCVFSFQILLVLIQYLLSFCGFSVLYKAEINSDLFPGLSLILPPGATVALYIIGSGLLFCSLVAVFNYGYYQFNETYQQYQKRFQPPFVKRTINIPTGCQGYEPHAVATVMLACAVCCKGPLIYEYVSIYKKTKHGLIMACIIADVFYMFSWILLWFAFTVKQRWVFKIYEHPMMSSRNSVYTIQNSHTAETPSGHIRSDNLEHSASHEHDGSFPDMPNGKIPNGAPVTLEMEKMDVTDSSHPGDVSITSPVSALSRRPKQRKTSGQRVTFNEDYVTPNPSFADDSAQFSPPSPSRRKKRRKNGSSREDADTSQERPISYPPAEPGVDQPEHINNAPKPIPDRMCTSAPNIYKESNTTPENTLTRDYRHSIRSKARQYYTRRNMPQPSPSMPRQTPPITNQKPNRGSGPKQANVPIHQSKNNLVPLIEKLPPNGGNIPSSSNTSHDTSKSSIKMETDVMCGKPPAPSATNILNKGGFDNHLHAPRNLNIGSAKKPEMGRRDSANFSLTSSQETSSNDSEQGLCSQV